LKTDTELTLKGVDLLAALPYDVLTSHRCSWFCHVNVSWLGGLEMKPIWVNVAVLIVLIFTTACSALNQTDGSAATVPSMAYTPGSKPDVPIAVRLDVVSNSTDQMVLSVFVQPRIASPATSITATLPPEIQLLDGELIWEVSLLADEVFTRTITIATQGVTSATGISLDAVHNMQGDSDYSFGKTNWLYLRRGTDGSIEFSHDFYFGELFVTPAPGTMLVVTATPGEPSITEPPGVTKPPLTQTPMATSTPSITEIPTVSP
jgi:hypothetical protein